jgi:hypothetical protein
VKGDAMPTIRIDEDVYKWLKSQAEPFEDTPNSVLRRLAGIDRSKIKAEGSQSDQQNNEMEEHEAEMMKYQQSDYPQTRTGEYLNRKWNVNALHALYHYEGTFYEKLKKFPGALFDPNGYILFKTEQEYLNSHYLKIGKKLNVHSTISSIPGYKRMVQVKKP